MYCEVAFLVADIDGRFVERLITNFAFILLRVGIRRSFLGSLLDNHAWTISGSYLVSIGSFLPRCLERALMKKETKVSIFGIKFKLIPHCLKEISKSENF